MRKDGSDGSMAPNQRNTTNIQRNHVKCGAILNFNMARDGSRMAPMAPVEVAGSTPGETIKQDFHGTVRYSTAPCPLPPPAAIPCRPPAAVLPLPSPRIPPNSPEKPATPRLKIYGRTPNSPNMPQGQRLKIQRNSPETPGLSANPAT